MTETCCGQESWLQETKGNKYQCEKRKKLFLLWFMTLETACVSRSRSAAFTTSFLQLYSVFSCVDHIIGQILVSSQRCLVPEEAGLHSNKVHHPRGIGIFPLIAFRVTGQAVIASASIMRLCTGDIYHDFWSLSVIK